MAHLHDPHTGFPNHGKSFRQQLFQGLTCLETLSEFRGFRLQRLVRQRLHIRLESVDTFYNF